MLKIENLRYTIGTFTLGPLNLSMERGEYLALFGPSGSGKSLLLELISGIRRADEGSLTISGKEVSDTPPHKRDVAMLFQDYALFPHMSVLQNIIFPMKMKGYTSEQIDKKVEYLIEYLSIKHIIDRDTDGLSGGERQRVALARAVACDPLLLLLDEPLSALDPDLRGEAKELLKLVKREGRTIIHVTHNREEIEDLADRTIVFHL
ncbi:MAG: ATP-binding cassette domain-containing protein [Bacteroidales bacterium]|jgi:ABC-type sugar transport system ATPase subunit|nr:ATP-binding cassette domain-containing protein [Bacteroidales bacterium]